MKSFKNWSQKNWAPYTIAACSAVILNAILQNFGIVLSAFSAIYRVLAPVLTGIILAYLIDSLVRCFERTIYKKVKKPFQRTISVLTGIILVLAAIVLLLIAIVPQLTASIFTLIGGIGEEIDALLYQVENLDTSAAGEYINLTALTELGEGALARIAEWLPANLENILNKSYSVGTTFTNLLLGAILSIYFLMDKEHLLRLMRALLRLLLKDTKYEALADFCARCDHILVRYIQCSLLESLIVGAANLLFMLILRMPYAPLISVIVALTNLAPTFGPIVGAVIGAFVLLLEAPWYAVAFLIFTLVLQTLDGYVIKPKLFGDTLGVSAILILVTIIVGGKIFGVVGILLAIPFAAILQYLCMDILLKNKISNSAE